MARDPFRALLSGDVHDFLEPGAERVERRPCRLVEAARALASTRDEQAAWRNVRSPRREAFAQRYTCEHDLAVLQSLLGAGQRRAYRRGARREVPGRKSRPHVLLMQHVRNAAHPGGRHRGSHDVAAHAKHHVGPKPVDDAQSGANGRRDEVRQSQVLPQGIAVEAANTHRLELEARRRHQPFFRTTGAPDEQNGAAWLLTAKRSRDGERRIQVPAGPAASDQKSHPTSDCSAMPNPSRGGRC